MKRIADSYQDLFEDLVHIFGGRQVEEKFKSDVSVIEFKKEVSYGFSPNDSPLRLRLF